MAYRLVHLVLCGDYCPYVITHTSICIPHTYVDQPTGRSSEGVVGSAITLSLLTIVLVALFTCYLRAFSP